MKHLIAAAVAACTIPAFAHAESLTFAWTPNPQTPQVDIAVQKGYFEEAGLDINFVAFPTGREGFEAMIGGQVDVAFMAEFPAAFGAVTGQDFAVIGDLARYTGSRVITRSEEGEIAALEDLAGKRIGTTIGTNVNFYLEEILKEAGIEAEIVGVARPTLSLPWPGAVWMPSCPSPPSMPPRQRRWATATASCASQGTRFTTYLRPHPR